MLAILVAAFAAWLAIDRIVRRAGDRRRLQLERLHDVALGLLAHDGVAMAARIDAALMRIAALVGAERIWIALGSGPDEFHGWSALDELDHLAAAAAAARILERFPWNGNAILVAPGGRATISWSTCLARRRAVPLSALMLRPRDVNDVALLCATGASRRLRVRPETVQGLAAVLLIAVHLDRHRRVEAERVMLESKLALGRRMETVGALASGIAHNLNNILNAVEGFRATAALHAAPGIMTESLDGMRGAVDRGASLVAEMLRFGRRVEGPPEPVNIDELLAETRKLVAASLPRGIALVEADQAPPGLRVAGEFGQLQQVLLNLCSNAAKAMPDGGAIECRSVPRVLDDPVRLSHGVLRRGRYATIVVSDEGRGIDESAIPYLFDAFYTTRAEGSGLGLSTAREIVERHGGAIDVDSTIGVGSRFTIWLPFADTPGSAEKPSRGAGEIVMLVNPDPRRLAGDEELLAALGYEPLGIAVAGAGALPADIGVVDAVVIASLDPGLADALAEEIARAGIAAPVLIAVPQPREGSGMLRYPFRPASVAYAIACAIDRGVEAPSMSTVA